MNHYMSITTPLSFGWGTSASGDTAQYIAKQNERWMDKLQRSYSLGLRGKGVFDDLLNVLNLCNSADWDGYGAQPVTYRSYQFACSFLKALPLGVSPPAISAEPDGHITLEWYRSSRHILSVSISPEGDLHYASLHGYSKSYGTEPYWGIVPRIILNLINRITPL